MGGFTYESEVITSIPPPKMFKACILDGDNLIPKIVPQVFKSVEYIEGNGEPGSIRKVTFAQGKGMKRPFLLDSDDGKGGVPTPAHRSGVDEASSGGWRWDKTNDDGRGMGAALGLARLEASPGGGSMCKTSSKYYTIGDIELKEEAIKAGKEKASGVLFKAIEAYLLANPDAF
ncbi:hypothetical protein GOBAR_DD21996 [Gossypium barbadense]|nr:hypothetical protein GOBAR_DD21996 [Gossypium barbadense]